MAPDAMAGAGGRPAAGRWPVIAIDTAAFAVMIVVAGLAIGPAYGGTRWLVALAAGAAVGLVAGSVPAWRRWPVLSTVALTVVGYFLVGPAVATPRSAFAGLLPNLESLRLLALGVVSGWKQMLTVADPVGSAGGLLIPAMLIGLVPAAVSSTVAGRARRPLWALLGPAAVIGAAAAFGTIQASHPAVAGTVVGLVALVWGAWRTGGLTSGGLDIRRPISAAALIVVAVAGALFVAPLMHPAANRTALREAVQLQFDPQNYPSPLSAFRRYVKTDETTQMITVSGLPKGARIRLATMDAYDGLFYNVSADSGLFTGVGDIIHNDVRGTPTTIDVTVDGYAGVWLPDVGTLAGVSFEGARAAKLSETLRFSSATGTAVVVAGLQQGDEYRISAIVPDTPDRKALEQAGIGSAPIGRTMRVPAALASAAATLTEDKETVFDKVDAIREALVDRGLFSHGEANALKSPAGHGYDRLLRLMNDRKMVGDQEQFAPAMALMVQSLGIPARVVLGFAPKQNDGNGSLTLTGGDVSAWVEVNFSGVGWVAFDPTPDQSKSEQHAAAKPETAPRRRIHQPPPPPRVAQDADAADAGTADTDKKKDDEPNAPVAVSGAHWVLAAGVGVPVLFFGGPIALILLFKGRRRRRWRRGAPAGQVAGGWERLLDGAVDLGAGVPAKLTRVETANSLDGHFGGSTAVLARTADRRVFGPEEPDPADAAEYWRDVDRALGAMRRSASPWRRIRAKLSTASLRRGSGVR